MATGAIVFLDKDGTLVEDIPYNADSRRMRLQPGVGEALRSLHDVGWKLVVVTNQSGVARGFFPESSLAVVEARLRELLGDFGVPLAGFYYCPHHPEGTIPEYAIACECRKPAAGMILAAAKQLGVDPRSCWMIGDSEADVEAGRRAGCRRILVRSLTTADVAAKAGSMAANLPEAAAIVLRSSPGAS